jgi:hypothetical protein
VSSFFNNRSERCSLLKCWTSTHLHTTPHGAILTTVAVSSGSIALLSYLEGELLDGGVVVEALVVLEPDVPPPNIKSVDVHVLLTGDVELYLGYQLHRVDHLPLTVGEGVRGETSLVGVGGWGVVTTGGAAVGGLGLRGSWVGGLLGLSGGAGLFLGASFLEFRLDLSI